MLQNSAGHDWPIYYADTVRTGSPTSDTAVISLWTKQDHVDQALSDDHYALLGQLYSQSYGIEILCRNLLANNTIRYLVVTGIDLNDVSPGLINLFEHGVDADNTITGTDIELSDDLASHIDTLHDRITLVDERRSNDFDGLNDTLASLPAKDPRGPEVILDLPDVVQPTRFPTDFSGFHVRGRTFEEAWYQLLRRILLFGEYDPDRERLRALNATMHVKAFDDNDKDLLSQPDNVDAPTTTAAIDDTDHAMIQQTRVEAWSELRGILNGATTPTTLTAQTVWLDEPDIKKALEAAAPRHKYDRNPDPRGNILVRVEDQTITLLHCNQKGEVIDEYQSSEKRDLFHHIEQYYKVSLTGHALDIGAEIQKAITALRNDSVEYEQDNPLRVPDAPRLQG